MHKLIAGLAAGLVMLAAAPAALAANVTVRVEGTADTLVPRTTVATSAGTFTKDGDPVASVLAQQRGRRARGRDARATGTAPGRLLRRLPGPDDQGRDAPCGTVARHLLVVLGQLPVLERRRLRDADAGRRRASCSSRAATAATAPATRRRCGSPSAPASAAAGQGLRRARRAVRVTVAGLQRDHHGRPRRARRWPRASQQLHRGRRRRRSRDGRLEGHRRRAGDEGRLRAVGDRAGVRGVRHAADAAAGLAGRGRHGRAGDDAGHQERQGVLAAGRRRGRCAATWPRIRRGCPGSRSGSCARPARSAAFFSGGRERLRRTHLCWHGAFFKIGDRADWSYLLPKRLGRGRYRLEAYAIDGAINRGPIKRVGFRVR